MAAALARPASDDRRIRRSGDWYRTPDVYIPKRRDLSSCTLYRAIDRWSVIASRACVWVFVWRVWSRRNVAREDIELSRRNRGKAKSREPKMTAAAAVAAAAGVYRSTTSTTASWINGKWVSCNSGEMTDAFWPLVNHNQSTSSRTRLTQHARTATSHFDGNDQHRPRRKNVYQVDYTFTCGVT